MRRRKRGHAVRAKRDRLKRANLAKRHVRVRKVAVRTQQLAHPAVAHDRDRLRVWNRAVPARVSRAQLFKREMIAVRMRDQNI